MNYLCYMYLKIIYRVIPCGMQLKCTKLIGRESQALLCGTLLCSVQEPVVLPEGRKLALAPFLKSSHGWVSSREGGKEYDIRRLEASNYCRSKCGLKDERRKV